jgi:isoleucyl-tRNA synthetase
VHPDGGVTVAPPSKPAAPSMLAAACRCRSRLGGSLPTQAWRRSLSVDSRERQRQLQLERKQRKLQKQQQLKQQAKKAQQKKAAKKLQAKPPGPPVNLPRTDFPMRADAARRELNYLARCTTDLYAWQERERPADGPRFVLHDGPPFANGVPHMGHALNKIIKDIVNRYRLLRGDRISYVPGWDCHGLPIELKALARLPGDSSWSAEDVPAVAVRSAARQEAEAAIVAQREQFERWGVMGDWERSYLTMTPEYEAGQLRIFRRMVEKGLIYRALRPVHWSPSAMTALAEAELEYNDAHCSRAVYVRFEVRQASPELTASGLTLQDCPGLSLVAWTTTPWSLVGNQALCVHPDLQYSVVRSSFCPLTARASQVARLHHCNSSPRSHFLPHVCFVG